MVERRFEEPGVGGSIPPRPTRLEEEDLQQAISYNIGFVK